MASLFSSVPSKCHLLDPGAGVGALTAAFCERVRKLRSPRTLIAHLFENDPALLPLLRRNLDNCKRVLLEAGHSLQYLIDDRDFIVAASRGLSEKQLFDATSPAEEYDAVIMNPPYFKVRKDSEHARLLRSIVHGQPNIYAFFMALGAKLLKDHGELVAITPRSFCNGLYFRGFRRWYFDRVALGHVHLFESAHGNVQALQRPAREHYHQGPSLGCAPGDDHGDKKRRRRLHRASRANRGPSRGNYRQLLRRPFVRIPDGEADREIMCRVESFPLRFVDTGLRISTGPVVLFRATEYLLGSAAHAASVPLLHPHNVKPFATIWPLAKNGKPAAMKCCEGSRRLLLPTRNYVLLKRFSSKEERRRLTAGCFLAAGTSSPYVAIENHVNYIYHAQRELTEDEVYGIAALFNSPLIDRYFRTISGTTQVNATEIRAMSFPPLKLLSRIGKRVRANTAQAETVVLRELGVSDLPANSLRGRRTWPRPQGRRGKASFARMRRSWDVNHGRYPKRGR